MEITITKMNFYRGRYWFWYFRKFKYVNGFVFRIFGIHIIVKEKDFIEKIIHIAEIHNICRINNIKYHKK